MRQQYHIRQVGEDIHVWDVHRLVTLLATAPVRCIDLKHIKEIEQAYWFPDSHPTTVQIMEHMQLVAAADLSYPIILDAEGRLMDGMHRVVKAVLAGNDDIKAKCFHITPAPDFINVDIDSLPYDDE